MAENPTPPNSENEPNPPSELDRYERLQRSAEAQLNAVKSAYDWHSNLLRTVVICATFLAAVLIGIFTYGFYHSLTESEQAANREIDAAILSMTNRVEGKVSEEERRIDSAIVEKFKAGNIEAKIQERVDSVTSDIISESIHKQIDPRLGILTNEIVRVSNDLLKAQISSADLKATMDLAMSIVMVGSDGRDAFDELFEMQFTTNRYQSFINLALGNALQLLNTEDLASSIEQPRWDVLKFDPSTNSFEEYMKEWNSTGDVSIRASLLDEMAKQDRISKFQKLQLYRDVLRTTPSLKLLAHACRALDKEVNIHENILGTKDYLEAINSQFCWLSISNYSQQLEVNSNDVTLYQSRADAYWRLTNFTAAIEDTKKALALNPTNAATLNQYAWWLATCPIDSLRNGKYAAALSKQACELSNWGQWEYLGTYAAACAEAGDFDNAVLYVQKAIDSEGVTRRAISGEKRRLKLYQSHLPTHEMPDLME